MKILQVNSVYNKGSTGKITYDIHTELQKQGIESIVCYGRGEKVSEPNVYKTCVEFYSKLNNLISRLTGIMYAGCFFSTNRLIHIIKKEKPDIVHLQCINGYFINAYRIVTWLKNNRIKTVLTLHAEFMYTANCGHAFECDKWKTGCGNCPRYQHETKSIFFDRTAKSWSKMKQAFDGFNNDLVVTSVSPWLMDRAKQSPILADKKHCVILNGVDTSVFHIYSEHNEKVLKNELGLGSQKVVFHATASFNNSPDHLKGGHYVIELAKKMPDVKFVVAGEHSVDMNVPSNLILLGKVTDQVKLAQLYSMADVTVLTSKKESFSMVTAESLCCGTPVVGFKSGAPEQIALIEYSEFVDYSNIDKLEEALHKILEQSIIKSSLSYLATQKYSREKMCSEYIHAYKEILK